ATKPVSVRNTAPPKPPFVIASKMPPHERDTFTPRSADIFTLVRYCARAPLSLERLSVSHCGKVIYKLRKPIRGKTHRVMEPHQFPARLCALIPHSATHSSVFTACWLPIAPCGGKSYPNTQEPTSQDAPAEN